jgi:hypothetical protein
MKTLPYLIATAALLAACEPAPPAEPEAPAAQQPQPAPPPTASTELLTAEGWQGLRIGMTRAEVVAALGNDANPDAVGGADPSQCEQFRPERAPEGMLVMVEQGRLTRISVSDPANVETEGGLSVGDSASAVRSHFAARAVVTPHKYVAAPAEYLTVWTLAPPAPDARGIVYEVGDQGRVTHIHAGGPSIQYVEGCS